MNLKRAKQCSSSCVRLTEDAFTVQAHMITQGIELDKERPEGCNSYNRICALLVVAGLAGLAGNDKYVPECLFVWCLDFSKGAYFEGLRCIGVQTDFFESGPARMLPEFD